MKRLLILTLLLTFSGKAKAEFFRSNNQTGWFHYNWKLEEEKKEKEEKKENKLEEYKATILNRSKLDNMTAAEIKKLEEEVRGYAVMNPTVESVYIWNKLLRYIGEKTEKFVQVNKELAHLYPDISKTPPSTIARRTYLREEKRKIEEAVREIAPKTALVVFEERNCPYCMAEKKVLKIFRRKYPDFYVREVLVSENPALAQRLQVERTPTIWLVYETDDGSYIWQIVSVGVAALDQIEKSIYEIKTLIEKGKSYGNRG